MTKLIFSDLFFPDAESTGRVTEKTTWSSDSLEQAVQLVEQHCFSMRKATTTMSIPFSTITKWYKKTNFGPFLERYSLFSSKEDEIENLLKKIANIFYDCTVNQSKKWHPNILKFLI